MPSTANYTANDTPAVVHRIEADLATVTGAVVGNDHGLLGLILTGGFARGEGTVLDGRPQNDYDLVAVRGVGRTAVSYAALRASLEARLGLHVDLAPVQALRLRWVAPSIFWYETALRGRMLWGDASLLDRIPWREPSQIGRDEPLRLLANRAAGLLLCARRIEDGDAVRIQAAKAILAALDARLLAGGRFAPSQTERWQLWQAHPDATLDPERAAWFDWAFQAKTAPDGAPRTEPQATWAAAAGAVVDAIPAALHHAGLASLDAHSQSDRLVDQLLYVGRAGRIQQARRWVAHPSAKLRVATLRMLRDCVRESRFPSESSGRWLVDFSRSEPVGAPLDFLEQLRGAAVQ